MTARIRLGIVGAGRIVRSEHLPRFRAIEGVDIVGVANRSADSSRRAAADLGLARAFDDWPSLVRDPDIDAVLIGAWPYLHAPVTIAALDARKHVLTEARMAATAEDARAMLRASLRHPGLVAMVVPASFSLWADGTIVRLIAEDAIGRVRHVRVTWDASGPDDPGEYWRWMRRYSGENVMALGIVYEAIARWIGPAHAVTAIANQGDPFRAGPSGPIRADVPDHVLAIAEFPDGVSGTIEMSTRTSPAESNRAILYGTTGTLIVDFAARRISRAGPDGVVEEVAVRDEDRLGWTVEADFVAAIRGERDVTLTDFATGVAYMSFLEATARSAAKGRRTIIAP